MGVQFLGVKQMNYKTSYHLLNAIYLIGTAIILLGVFFENGVAIYFGIFVVALGAVQGYAFCKCPHCGKHFSFKEKLPKYCSECGKKLE